MSKRFLDKFFNADYFKLLFKRHISLCAIPLAVFFCLLVLFGILGYDPDALFMFVLPYAVAIVPLTALILFKPYTKKGDISYLLSVPMTRTQMFITTYLVGLTMIELTLIIMTPITMMQAILHEQIKALVMFVSLGIIYYTFACLGCMMGGQTLTQFLIMGVICFGPVALYLLSKVSVASLTFGNYSTPMNDSLIMLVCPLVSALDFIGYNTIWPYWWAHILLVIGAIALSVYLMKHRPIEQTEQGTLFKNVDKWIVKPVIYLNIVFVIFNICLYLVVNQSHYYDISYYMSVLALLLGSALLVNFLMAIWTSKDLKSLFNIKECLYQGTLIILACCFLFIPLWQNEQARTKLLHEHDNLVTIEMPYYSYRNYSTFLDKETLLPYLEAMSEDRTSFKSSYSLNDYEVDENIAGIHIDYNQYYYFDISKASGRILDLTEQILLDVRENLSIMEDEWVLIQGDDGMYLKENVIKAIMKTYQEDMPDNFLTQSQNIESIHNGFVESNAEMYDFLDFIRYYYPLTFTQLDYASWVEEIMDHCKPDFSNDQWQDIVDCATDFNKGTITSKHLESILDIIEVYEYSNSQSWYIDEVSENHLEIQYSIYALILSDYESEDMTLFEGTDMTFTIQVDLDKVDGEWIPTFKGVYY